MYCDLWLQYIQIYRCGNYSREETIQGQKLFTEIRYESIKSEYLWLVKLLELKHLRGKMLGPYSFFFKEIWTLITKVDFNNLLKFSLYFRKHIARTYLSTAHQKPTLTILTLMEMESLLGMNGNLSMDKCGLFWSRWKFNVNWIKNRFLQFDI